MAHKKINLKELKQIQLAILDKVDEFCREKSINYFLAYGTLIGAARHEGYIPWDDDIDIVMERLDYERFFSEFNQGRNDSLRAISWEIDRNFYLPYGKIINNNTEFIEENNYKLSIGVNIDVFPLDKLPNDSYKEKTLLRKIRLYRNILTFKSVEISQRRPWYKNAVLMLMKSFLTPISKNTCIKNITKLAKTYNNDSRCTKLANFTVLIYGDREIWYAEDYASYVDMNFEGRIYRGPCNYDRILKTTYGDYMQFPPAEKQVSHHIFEAYWKY